MDRFQRRQFLLIAGALLGMPWSGFAQQGSKVWRVGFLHAGSRAPFVDEFPKGMREIGYEEAKNLVIEWRFADGHYDRLPALAAELVSRKVDVIVGSGTPAVGAAKRATSTVPIVMALVGDPVASGFVASLAQPGGNITGLSLANPEISTKWLELARVATPASQIGVLADSSQPTAQWYVKDIQGTAQKLGIKVPVIYAPTVNDIDNAFASLARERVATVIVLPSGMFASNAAQIAESAVKRRIASIGTSREFGERSIAQLRPELGCVRPARGDLRGQDLQGGEAE
jgi:putative ABC transport system substrate-binding protein